MASASVARRIRSVATASAGLGLPGGVVAGEPLGLEPRGAVDRDEAELALAGVREAVRYVRRPDHDVTRRHDQRLAAELERRLARLDDEHFGVGMPMELRADARLRVHEDHRER